MSHINYINDAPLYIRSHTYMYIDVEIYDIDETAFTKDLSTFKHSFEINKLKYTNSIPC